MFAFDAGTTVAADNIYTYIYLKHLKIVKLQYLSKCTSTTGQLPKLTDTQDKNEKENFDHLFL